MDSITGRAGDGHQLLVTILDTFGQQKLGAVIHVDNRIYKKNVDPEGH